MGGESLAVKRALGIAVTVLVALLVAGCGSSGSSVQLSGQGRLIWQFEALLHDTFGKRPLCARITRGSDNFEANTCIPLALYSPYWYEFANASGSHFHISDKVAIDFGNYPVPVLINGRGVACNAKETQFLIEYPDAASFTLGCSTAGFVRPYAAGEPLYSAPLPTLLADGPHGRLIWQVRPASVAFTGDGSGILGGFDGSGAHHASHPGHLTWTSWTPKEAIGSGAVWADNCTPDCAEGKFAPYAAKVRAFRPVKGRFTRLTIRSRYHGKLYIDRRGIERTGSFWSYYIVGR